MAALPGLLQALHLCSSKAAFVASASCGELFMARSSGYLSEVYTVDQQ